MLENDIRKRHHKIENIEKMNQGKSARNCKKTENENKMKKIK